jgi:hypothetical protein
LASSGTETPRHCAPSKNACDLRCRTPFLHKPFTFDGLGRKMREVLDR